MISTKNRAYLRSLSNTLEALYQIGKGGVTPAVAQTLDDALEARELIQISLLETCPTKPKETMTLLIAALGCEPVQTIGRKLVIFRRSSKEENRKIVFPR